MLHGLKKKKINLFLFYVLHNIMKYINKNFCKELKNIIEQLLII